MDLIYLNNKIEIKKCDLSFEVISNIWNVIREDYNAWLSQFKFTSLGKDKNIIKELEWRGLSTWWVNNLIQKDTELNNNWLNRMYILYILKIVPNKIYITTDDEILFQSIKSNFEHFEIKFIKKQKSLKLYLKKYIPIIYILLKTSYLFLGDLFKIVILNIIQKKNILKKDYSEYIFFRTLYPANLKINNSEFFDRHYSKSIFENNEKKIALLVYFKNYKSNSIIANIQTIYNLYFLQKNKDILILFPESFISIYDLINVYLFSISKIKIFSNLNRSKKLVSSFRINDINFYEILFHEFFETFLGPFQYSILHGLSLGKLLKNINSPKAVVTYGEFFAQSRAFYFFGKTNSNKTKFISVQHSYNCSNYCTAYNHPTEFSAYKWIKDSRYSPMPDFFYVQGKQYGKILETFYPKNKIKIIGNLKFDLYLDKIQDYKKKFNKNLTKKNYILILPSTNDFEFLINKIKTVKLRSDLEIIISPHPNNSIKKIKEMIKGTQIKYIKNKSSNDLLLECKLVISSYSNMAIEAFLFGKSSIRLIESSSVPLFESDQNIPQFFEVKKLILWINNNIDKNKRSKKEINKILNHYYFKCDKHASKRFWNYLNKEVND